MEGVKLLRLKTIGGGDHAIVVISDFWLFAKELKDYLVLYKKPTILAELLAESWDEARKEGYAFLVVETDKRTCFPLEKVRRVFLDTAEWISAETEKGGNKT